jgi:hypothetical protein
MEVRKYYVCDQLKKVGPIEDEYIVKHADHVAEIAALKAERDALNALMELAGADIIFFHSQEYGPFIGPETPEIPQKVQFSVMVNDLFVPAADSEGFDISEAIPLRDVFRSDGWEGVVRWVQKKRDNMPLRPHIEKRVREKEIAARCGERTECMKIDWEHKHMTDLRNAIATTDESIISDEQLLAQPGKMFNRIANLERQLAEMTTDRDLWKDDHDGDCPYQTQLAAAQAAIAALQWTPITMDNLPLKDSEVIGREGLVETVRYHSDLLRQSFAYSRMVGWTHFRPISPPAQARAAEVS